MDLIIMGTKGLKGIEKLLFGSVADNAIRYSKVPVLIVR
jgi:nucleotide-binding universal stress UspA family protein